MSDIARNAGISRQAIYLHFPSRLDLLVAATRYQDDQNDIVSRLAASRAATSGRARLEAFVAAWGGYIPVIYPVARALLAERETDPEAAAAWDARMQDMREGCAAAVAALADDGTLAGEIDTDRATDLLWTLLSVRNWEQLTQTCGWAQARYLDTIRALALTALAGDAQALSRALTDTAALDPSGPPA